MLKIKKILNSEKKMFDFQNHSVNSHLVQGSMKTFIDNFVSECKTYNNNVFWYDTPNWAKIEASTLSRTWKFKKNIKSYKNNMTRVKGGRISKIRHSKTLKLTKGFVGSHSKLFRIANQQLMRALRYSYYDRKKKKNIYRKLWITRINIRSRKLKASYSVLIKFLKKFRIHINRKLLCTKRIFSHILTI